MQAAQSAAQADGLAPPSASAGIGGPHGMSQASATALQQARSAIAAAAQNKSGAQHHGGAAGGGKKKGPPLRRGKWTPEEEAYANRLIQEFKAGLLPLTDGTTLRTFLSKLLNCDPMRISKKFVGSNCIGKQVFRRRNADLNRLTPDQIQQSRAELSELERRFLERVAQTNRVKSSGVGGGGAGAAAAAASAPSPAAQASGSASKAAGMLKQDEDAGSANDVGGGGAEPPSPPWLNPPMGYKHGAGAAFASANLSGANSRAAAAGRALLGNSGSAAAGAPAAGNNYADSSINEGLERKLSQSGLASRGGSAGFLAMAQIQRQASQQQLLRNALASGSSAGDLLAAAARSGSNAGLSSNSMMQLAQNASGTLHFCGG